MIFIFFEYFHFLFFSLFWWFSCLKNILIWFSLLWHFRFVSNKKMLFLWFHVVDFFSDVLFREVEAFFLFWFFSSVFFFNFVDFFFFFWFFVLGGRRIFVFFFFSKNDFRDFVFFCFVEFFWVRGGKCIWIFWKENWRFFSFSAFWTSDGYLSTLFLRLWISAHCLFISKKPWIWIFFCDFLRQTHPPPDPLLRTPFRQNPPSLPPPDPAPPQDTRTPFRQTAENFTFFFPVAPLHFRSFSLSGGLAVWALWVIVWNRRPHQTGPRGLARDDPENSRRAFWRAPQLQTPPRRRPERAQRVKIQAGEEKKKREILGSHPSGRRPSPLPLFAAAWAGVCAAASSCKNSRNSRNTPLPLLTFLNVNYIFTIDETPLDFRKKSRTIFYT